MGRRPGLYAAIAGSAVAIVGAGCFLYVWAVAPARKFVDETRRLGGSAQVLAIALEADRAQGAPRPKDVRLWTAAGEVRDVVVTRDRTVVLTSGGAIVRETGGERLLTTLDGLSDVDLRAGAAWRGNVVLGGADGRLTLLGDGRAKILRVRTATGPVQEIVEKDGVLFVAWLGGGAAALDPEALRAVPLDAEQGRGRRAELASVSALAVGATSHALGTVDGAVYWGERKGPKSLCASVPGGRVTALALDGDSVLVGTPLGLFAPDGRGGCQPLRRDLFVTALSVDGPLVYAATFDDGVLVLDRSSGGLRDVAHLLRGVRVDRLRRTGGEGEGTLLAVGPSGAFALGAGSARPYELPQAHGDEGRLANAHVTSLLRLPGGQLWVGTFERGVSVLDPAGRIVGQLPSGSDPMARQTIALVWLPASREVAIATVRGLVLASETGERRLGRQQGLAGDEVSGLAVAADGALFAATNRGLTAFSGPPGREVGRSIGALHGLPSNHVYAVARSGRTTFVGTLAGLALLRDLKVEKTVGARGGPLRHGWVTAIAPAREQGAVWIGTNGGGVARVTEEGLVEGVAPDEPGFHVNPGALAVDPFSGDVIVGTLERGALVVDASSRRVRELDAPLPSRNVTAVLVEYERIFLGTDRGLVSVPRKVQASEQP